MSSTRNAAVRRPAHPPRHGRRGRTVFVLPGAVTLLLAAGVVLVAVGRGGSEPRLFDRATRVLAVPPTWLRDDRGRPTAEPLRYFWTDENVLLRFAVNGANGYQGVRVGARTGRETPVPALRTRPVDNTGDARWFAASPDRRWLLWSDRIPGTNREHHLMIARTDGSLRVERPRHLGGNLLWMGDSRRFASREWDRPPYTVHIGARDDPAVARVVQPPAAKRLPWLIGFTPAGQALAVDLTPMQRSGALRSFAAGSDYLLVLFNGAVPAPAVHLVTFSVERNAPPSLFSVAFPPRTEQVLVFPAPRGDRIAYLARAAERSSADPLRAWLARVLPRLVAPPRRRFANRLYVGRSDGTGPRLVGVYETVFPGRGGPGRHTDDLRYQAPKWTRDGKQVSLIHDGALWTVPAL